MASTKNNEHRNSSPLCSHELFTYTDQDGPDRGKTLLSWLKALLSLSAQEQSQQLDINIDSINTAKFAFSNWPEICEALCTLLVKPCVRKVIVPIALMNMVVGKCGHVLKTKLLQSLPPSIQLYEQTVDTKLVLNMTVFTDKITCKLAKQNFDENAVVNFLKDLVDKSSHDKPCSPILVRTVVRANKFLHKASRKHWFKKDSSDPKDESKREGKKKSSAQKLETDALPMMGARKVKCYVCKERYMKRRKKKASPELRQYPRLCGPCAQINFVKRTARVDLTGKYAVVTGGRIKIGFELVLKLLRDGCTVIVTTRFPRNAARDYSKQKDYEEWKERLKIYPLDLKDIAGVYRFVAYVKSAFPHLDILINNAAQTLRRPMDFYRELLDLEQIPFAHIPPLHQSVLASPASLDYGCSGGSMSVTMQPAPGNMHAITHHPRETLKIEEVQEDNVEMHSPVVAAKRPHESPTVQEEDDDEPLAKTPKVESLGEDPDADKPERTPYMRSNSEPCSSKAETSETATEKPKPKLQAQKSLGPLCAVSSPQVQNNSAVNPFSLSRFFPRGLYDDDGQQLDLRRTNTWRSVMQSVSLGEFMEVFVVNTVAPFILNKELKPHLRKKTEARKFIVNVSAMEGQFNRAGKNKFHPHTNMAKAALNMMTRTAALEYKECDIYMTSVDTGWVSDERPLHLAKKEEKKGFMLPLDCVDGAARVYDPIVTGYLKPDTPHFAVFLKNYDVYPW